MDFLIVLIGIGTLAAIIAAIGWWILSPIDRAAKSRRASIQFSIGDFLCLFIALQLPLIASHFLAIETQVDARRSFWIITLITWIIAPLIWFFCARSLSKAQVRNGVHRFIFLGLIVPFVYYAFLPYLVLSFSIISLLLSGVHSRGTDSSRIVFIAWVALTFAFFPCGLFTRWMLSQVTNDAPPGSRSNGESESTPVA